MTLSIRAELAPLNMDKNGTIRVGETRVTLETVITAFLDGYTPEEIIMQFSVLNLADIYAVIAYYLRHREEVEVYLQQVEEESQAVRKELQFHSNQAGVRARLLARQNNQP